MSNTNAVLQSTCLFLLVGSWTCLVRQSSGEEIAISAALLRIVDSADIPAAIDGVLEKVLVREGDIVETGTLLAVGRDEQARIRAAQATVDADIAARTAKNPYARDLARKKFELAVTEVNRAHEVNRGFANSVSEKELNILRLARDKSKLEMHQAEFDQEEAALKHQLKLAELELAKSEVEKYQIRASIPGMVVHVNRKPGEWVSAGEVVVRIVRVDKVRAEGFVAAVSARNNLVGRSASIRVGDGVGGYSSANGMVVFVSPDADPVDGRVRVWVEFDNENQALRPGLRGDVRIHERTPAISSYKTAPDEKGPDEKAPGTQGLGKGE